MKQRRMYSVSDLIVGLLDANVFIHAQTNDISSQECREFLQAVERGSVRVEIPPVVLHELTYALPRYLRQLSRADVATYLLSVLHWPGIRGDNELMIDAVKR
jgi:predicted nucleic acid-binding protein